jgi:two-component system chemotaxis response regulator CheB
VPPRLRAPVRLIVLAASAGGLKALRQILGALPPDFQVPIAIVFHRPAQLPSYLPEILQRVTPRPVKQVTEPGEPLLPGRIYLAPPDLHLRLRANLTFSLSDGRRIRFLHSSANPLLESAASVLDGGVVAVILTGGGADGTDGVQTVKAQGGVVIAQDRATSAVYGMPGSAVETGVVDLVLPLDEIAPALVRIADGEPPAALARQAPPVPSV